MSECGKESRRRKANCDEWIVCEWLFGDCVGGPMVLGRGLASTWVKIQVMRRQGLRRRKREMSAQSHGVVAWWMMMAEGMIGWRRVVTGLAMRVAENSCLSEAIPEIGGCHCFDSVQTSLLLL